MPASEYLTSDEVARLHPRFAAVPIGSFEQHGPHLPLETDALLAHWVARDLCARHGGLLTPTIGVSCSHEHGMFPGTLSISAETLIHVVRDTVASVERQGIALTVLVNMHGGNYVLGNVAQELNVDRPRVLVAPARQHWAAAAEHAGVETPVSDDMHGGEMETSMLLYAMPEVVRLDRAVDHAAPDRRLLTLLGVRHYAERGTVGRPSRATAEKGERLFAGLIASVGADVEYVCTLAGVGAR